MKDHGAAFPIRGAYAEHQDAGMTLRDYFAAHCPVSILDDGQGTIAEAAKELGIPVNEYDGKKHFPILQARRAYAWADAMLEAR